MKLSTYIEYWYPWDGSFISSPVTFQRSLRMLYFGVEVFRAKMVCVMAFN